MEYNKERRLEAGKCMYTAFRQKGLDTEHIVYETENEATLRCYFIEEIKAADDLDFE